MEKQIMYRFSKMELEQFATFEENLTPKESEVQFQTEAQFSYDKANTTLCSLIVVSMAVHDKPLAKVELKSYFVIHPESINLLRHDGKIVFTPNLLVQFSSLCFGAMRGVLFAKTLGSPLNDYVLPPVYFGNIIDKSFVVEDSV